ncbi:MAG: peptide-methionine (R)-S-oxide reductase MsrB [Sphingosinicella sp.]
MRRLSRRGFVSGAAASVAAVAAALMVGRRDEAKAENFELELTPAQWRARLSREQYRVLRQEATERAGSSPLDREHRRGAFHCAGCALPVFRSADKFDSGTGWPSFTRPIAGNVRTRPDNTFFMRRTECHCRRCGGHLGHVFDDGPPPTGERWCINGVALRFVPTRG